MMQRNNHASNGITKYSDEQIQQSLFSLGIQIENIETTDPNIMKK